MYTLIKIDEVNNLGAVKIRIRSLLASMNKRLKDKELSNGEYGINKKAFTKEMKPNYTILIPQMIPVHFELFESALKACGYNAVLLRECTEHTVETGLKYVNNDACYPSILTTGQFIEALESGKYDVNKTAIMMSQTGGGCRATNYIGFIRRALIKAGLPQIPVISISAGIESNPGMKFDYKTLVRAFQSLVYGDVFMKVVYATRPYEKVEGSVNALHEKWVAKCIESLKKADFKTYKKNLRQIIKEFDEIELLDIKKPKVGIVGEILVKFMPAANNYLVEQLEAEGAEAVCPDLIDFFLYCVYDAKYKYEYFGKPKKNVYVNNFIIKLLETLRKSAKEAFEKSNRFHPTKNIAELAKLAEPFVSMGNQTGEGWFLTAEMIELITSGTNNIVCAQPFACLPNHIVGKGVIKSIRQKYPKSNIVAIDYDPGASEVNQLNRIKLMLSTAKKNL